VIHSFDRFFGHDFEWTNLMVRWTSSDEGVECLSLSQVTMNIVGNSEPPAL
jgi:mannose/cellobiose epimerase-like protein (N-acyl-D-glucosamine 2-epimerase family)